MSISPFNTTKRIKMKITIIGDGGAGKFIFYYYNIF